MKQRTEHLARLARGRDEAADGCERYYFSRFAPWVAIEPHRCGYAP